MSVLVRVNAGAEELIEANACHEVDSASACIAVADVVVGTVDVGTVDVGNDDADG
jgi:hypothetical protein